MAAIFEYMYHNLIHFFCCWQLKLLMNFQYYQSLWLLFLGRLPLPYAELSHHRSKNRIIRLKAMNIFIDCQITFQNYCTILRSKWGMAGRTWPAGEKDQGLSTALDGLCDYRQAPWLLPASLPHLENADKAT